MRKQVLTLTFALFALLLTTSLEAQLRTTPASPSAKVETTIGLTDVHIEYSRPGVKGRKIFALNGLVPFGQVWRTGANQATKITFGGDVMIGGEEVPAGSYAVLSKPFTTEWEVMFFPYETGNWGSYVDKTPAVTTKVKSMASEGKVEAFTIDVQNYTLDGADIVMKWDNTMVAVPVKTNAKTQIMASIDRIMAGPGMNDYYNAASFLHENGDKEKALEYINKAVAMGGDNPRYWMVRRQGLILVDMGMKEKATDAFNLSAELAEKAGNMDYVRMNEKSILELNY
ncbi:DUF2911 domain-containing protein [Lewinella sp. W8]|uniref:DUF2911 domain-containing protein n=1 Tax=Lewinella sp. W8 TaxID=2528208 RepID=UPI001067CE6D|nr:DUF2911 domain-containing protein [Lewinella sp. W8]MTB50516.1 DUF2911 domain-containing protein [Lewinella sp. W8]